jgi:hypothetical protein
VGAASVTPPACRVLRVRDCGGADEAGRLMRITGGAI